MSSDTWRWPLTLPLCAGGFVYLCGVCVCIYIWGYVYIFVNDSMMSCLIFKHPYYYFIYLPQGDPTPFSISPIRSLVSGYSPLPSLRRPPFPFPLWDYLNPDFPLYAPLTFFSSVPPQGVHSFSFSSSNHLYPLSYYLLYHFRNPIFCQWSSFTFLVSEVATGYGLTSEDLERGAFSKRELMMCVFLGLGFLSQNYLF